MTALVGSVIGSLAGKFLTAIGRGRTGPSFADVLRNALPPASGAPQGAAAWARSAGMVREAMKVEYLAGELEDLPVTSDEARRIAVRLWAVVQNLRGADESPDFADEVTSALEGFLSEMSEKFMLSEDDIRQLSQVTNEYMVRELPEAAGLSSPTPAT